ncbi:unnamed protein product [Caenorhabditis brenneri]
MPGPKLVAPCTVCRTNTTSFNYGVHSCDACKNFFRRCLLSLTEIKQCTHPKSVKKCQWCRLQCCITAGMTLTSRLTEPILPTNIGAIIGQLRFLDDSRQESFLKLISKNSLSLDDLVNSDKIDCELKPKNHQSDFYDWATMNQITAITFIKRLEFMKTLQKEEKSLLIKSTYIRFLTIINAMRAILSNKEETRFPGDVDIFPSEVQDYYQDSPQLLNAVRCRLVAKLRDLKIKYEEFLLLTVIFICNPAMTNYSPLTSGILAQHQRIHSSALWQFCLINYQNSGPVRFLELLSLIGAIHKQYEAFGSVIIEFRSAKPDFPIQKLFDDGIEQMLR